jgi:signal transduction histidine kinase
MLSNSLKHTNEGGTIEFRLESLENINMTASFALDLDIKDEEGE